jgi:hypothetical protein
MAQSFKYLVLVLVSLLGFSLSACASQVGEALDVSNDAGNVADILDAGDASLPQCSPLGGPSGRYCNTTDDGHCMTTVCECTDKLGNRIPTTVTPMVGYDGGCADAG